MTNEPPKARTPKMSNTERSKPSDETISPRSSSPTFQRFRTSTMVFKAARWVITTPFGSPVESEVKIT